MQHLVRRLSADWNRKTWTLVCQCGAKFTGPNVIECHNLHELHEIEEHHVSL